MDIERKTGRGGISPQKGAEHETLFSEHLRCNGFHSDPQGRDGNVNGLLRREALPEDLQHGTGRTDCPWQVVGRMDGKERGMKMERFYLVKTVSKATANNQSYCGETHTYIHGKEEYLLFADTRDKFVARDLMTPYFVRQYGYKRECDARRAYSYTHPENTEYWNSTAEIITVEVYEGYCKQI